MDDYEEGKGKFKLRVETTKIHDVLLSIGIPPNLLGYSYLLYGIELVLLNPIYLHAITKGLYVDIAKKFSTTPICVERAIRTAIGTGWLRGDMNYVNDVFKGTIDSAKGVPTNSLFFSRMYYYLSCNAA